MTIGACVYGKYGPLTIPGRGKWVGWVQSMLARSTVHRRHGNNALACKRCQPCLLAPLQLAWREGETLWLRGKGTSPGVAIPIILSSYTVFGDLCHTAAVLRNTARVPRLLNEVTRHMPQVVSNCIYLSAVYGMRKIIQEVNNSSANSGPGGLSGIADSRQES
jgi:hypothetical protein